MNENGDSFGKYCGNHNGQSVLVNGSLVVLSFRAGIWGSDGRFRLLFIPVNGKYNTKIELKSHVRQKFACSKRDSHSLKMSNRDCFKIVAGFWFFSDDSTFFINYKN